MRLSSAVLASILVAACSKPQEPASSIAAAQASVTPVESVVVPFAASAAPPASADDKALAPSPGEVRVRLAADGQTRMGDQLAQTDADLSRLTKEAAKTPNFHVVIDADDQVPYSRVIHVMDILKQAGTTRIGLATPSSTFPAAGGPPVVQGTGTVEVLMVITLAANGTAQINAKPIANDEAIARAAQDAHRRNTDIQARIDADGAVPQGRVIHVMDQLKAAGISRIAFGVAPQR